MLNQLRPNLEDLAPRVLTYLLLMVEILQDLLWTSYTFKSIGILVVSYIYTACKVLIYTSYTKGTGILVV